MMLALLALVDCSTAAVDASDLEAHLQRELGARAERFTATCEGDDVHLRSQGGVDLAVPLADVPYSARGRTIALALAEHLRIIEEEPPPAATSTSVPKLDSAETIDMARTSLWRLSVSLEAGTAIDLQGLLAGLGFDVARKFSWFSLHGSALIEGGKSDNRPLLAFTLRAGATLEIPLADTLDLELGVRIDGGPVIGVSDNPGLGAYFGGGGDAGLRWAFASPVQLRVQLAAIYTTSKVALMTLAVGVAFDLGS